MTSLWERFERHFLRYDDLDFALDISRVRFPDNFFDKLKPRITRAFADMAELEKGAVANPDEQRMVGHHWLRNAELAPNAQVGALIALYERAVGDRPSMETFFVR
jgi:glucose-6-phosphate isomerase